MEEENGTLLDFGPVEDRSKGIIKVIGVGGGGCNAVRNMFDEGLQFFALQSGIAERCIKAIQDFAYSGFGGRGGKHGDIFWDNESYAIKHYLKMFADLASATLKQVADWFVWLAGTLGRFNANELRRADHEVHDIADGRYDGRIQKYQQGLTR